MKKKVVVGMSGGVDSSATAALLLEQGYDVIGITMKLWEESKQDEKKCDLSDAIDAKKVCDKLGIPHYVFDFQEEFKDKVINYFMNEYIHGKTPNPCIACNKYIKFDELLNKAMYLEADYIATGHYAKVEYYENLDRYLLKKSTSVQKDQTYVLYNLKQQQLKHILMPLGYYTKDKVREIAKRFDLNIASKPESQEICFVQDNNYSRFIKENTDYKDEPGNFVDTNGNVLGKHKGIIHYTVGQRKGLGIAFGKPMFVTRIDIKNNNVILGEDKDVFSDELILNDVNFIPFDTLQEPIEVTAKIRYLAKEAKAIITPLDKNTVRVKFEQPQRAITPGQAVVFYNGEIVVGGGIIE